MTKVIGRTEGHYEVQETSYGEAYVWCPPSFLVECDYGEMLHLSASEAVCRCGADHAILLREELETRLRPERSPHPWDAEYYEWREANDGHLRGEHHHWMEWRIIE